MTPQFVLANPQLCLNGGPAAAGEVFKCNLRLKKTRYQFARDAARGSCRSDWYLNLRSSEGTSIPAPEA